MGLRLRLFRILSEPRCARGDLDFVFLDGDHRYSSVRRDLKVLVPRWVFRATKATV